MISKSRLLLLVLLMSLMIGPASPAGVSAKQDGETEKKEANEMNSSGASQAGSSMEMKWVLIDTSEAAYTVFVGLSEDAMKALKTKGLPSNAELAPAAEFRKTAGSRLLARIEYKEAYDEKLAKELVEILQENPETPIGITWNGGMAITYNDYEAAKRQRLEYLKDPEAYRQKHPKKAE